MRVCEFEGLRFKGLGLRASPNKMHRCRAVLVSLSLALSVNRKSPTQPNEL